MLLMPTDNEKPLKDAYVIVPLYSISVNRNDLPISCGEWELIDKKYFHENYSEKIRITLSEFKEDIADKKNDDTKRRPLADYILIRKYKRFYCYTNQTDRDIYEQKKLEIDLLITSFRLINKDYAQINRAYIISEGSEGYVPNIKAVTPLNDIGSYSPYIDSGPYIPMNCSLDKNYFNKTVSLSITLGKCYEKLKIPLFYFNKYFNSIDLIDMVINLSIIWESTILSDRNNELKNALWLRGTYLFGIEHGNVLKLAYDARSEIVHTGDITKNTLKKMKTIIGTEQPQVGLIFDFIKGYLEPITRDIINYFIRELDKDVNLTAKAIADKIENQMIAKLGQRDSAT